MEIAVTGTIFKADTGKAGDGRQFNSVGVMVLRKDGDGADPVVIYPEGDISALKYGQKVLVVGQAKIEKLYKATVTPVK